MSKPSSLRTVIEPRSSMKASISVSSRRPRRRRRARRGTTGTGGSRSGRASGAGAASRASSTASSCRPSSAAELVELALAGATEVDPDDRVGLGQVVGHLGQREVLRHECALAKGPRRDATLGLRGTSALTVVGRAGFVAHRCPSPIGPGAGSGDRAPPGRLSPGGGALWGTGRAGQRPCSSANTSSSLAKSYS